jgi:hypothetical protein
MKLSFLLNKNDSIYLHVELLLLKLPREANNEKEAITGKK